jgi:hypothetical protein
VTVLPQCGWVFCIEVDGQVTLEAGNVSGRCTDEEAEPFRSAIVAPLESHCGDCQDQVIDADETRRASSSEGIDLPVYHPSEVFFPILHTYQPVERSAEAVRPPTRRVHLLNAAFLL